MSPGSRADWRWQTRERAGAPIIMASLQIDGRAARIADVLAGWRSDDDFRRQWSRWLADIPIASYCWEMPPLTIDRLHSPFECVFVESPGLGVPRADPEPFAAFFPASPSEQDAVIFPNLGGDALLIAPTPQAQPEVYPHLARFLRSAPAHQIESIWQFVAKAVDRRLGAAPLWLSTAGLGVAWLLVRVDSIPKYYRYRPYASAA